MRRFLTIFSGQTQQTEVRIVAIISDYFSPLASTPFHFSRTLLLEVTVVNRTYHLFMVLQLKITFTEVKSCVMCHVSWDHRIWFKSMNVHGQLSISITKVTTDLNHLLTTQIENYMSSFPDCRRIGSPCLVVQRSVRVTPFGICISVLVNEKPLFLEKTTSNVFY